MLELEIGGHRTPVPVGELVIGTDASCGLRLGGEGLKPRHAVVTGAADGSASVQRGEPGAEVSVNGVRLGGEPAPVLHGDKLQVGPHELLITDPTRGGSTQFVSAADIAKMVSATSRPPGSTAKPPTAATGGRLVCLTDGREYTVGETPLVVGREAGCDIVVPNKDVSRRHAEILATPQGYLLIDSSTNGSFVNGDRVEGQRLLARADVIRIGDHEFRFYADRATAAPVAEPPAAAPPAAAAPAAAPPAEAPAPPAPSAPAPEGAAARLSQTMAGMPVTPPPGSLPAQPGPVSPPRAAPPPAARPSEAAREPRPSGPTPMATILVRGGQLKGTRFPIKVPVVNIGRADFNDIVIPDDSVSGMHAKLQRREGVWILIDNDSTNGTYVDGERVQGEAAVSPGAVLRFGEISAMFEPTDDELGVGKGTGTKVVGAIRPEQASRPPEAAPAPLPPPAAPPPALAPTPAPSPPPVWAPSPEMPRAKPSPRPQVIVSSPPKRGVPSWVAPVVVIVIMAIIAIVLLTR